MKFDSGKLFCTGDTILISIRYLDAFPGLVHFIYIDRRTNQLTAPSLNITDEGENHDATQFLKDKVKSCNLFLNVSKQSSYVIFIYLFY